MKTTLPFARVSRQLWISLAISLNACFSGFAAYDVSSIGSWTTSITDLDTLAGALHQTDVIDEGVRLTADLHSDVWTGWTKGSADPSSILLLPTGITYPSADGWTFSLDLNGNDLGGTGFSLVTGNGSMLIENGSMELEGGNLSVGTDGAANVTLKDVTLNANELNVGAAGADYKGSLRLENSVANVSSVTINSVYEKDATVDIAEANPTFSAQDSTINLNSGTFTMSGAGDKPSGMPTNDAGKILMQEIDENGNLVYNDDNSPKIVQVWDDDAQAYVDATTSADYYYNTGVLVDSHITGASAVTLEEGASLKMYGNSSIETGDILITGSGNGFVSKLSGTGDLIWTGDMDLLKGGQLDISQISVNGDSAGSLHIGKNTAQRVELGDNAVSYDVDGNPYFSAATLLLNGDLTVGNGSELIVRDASRILGAEDLLIDGPGSRVSFGGELFSEAESKFEASGSLSVTNGATLGLDNGWHLNFKGDAYLNGATVYVGIDRTSATPGVGTYKQTNTRLDIDGDALLADDQDAELYIEGGASMTVGGSMVIANESGSNGLVSIDKKETSYPSDSGPTSLRIKGDLTVGKSGNAVVEIGRTSHPEMASKIVAGSTLLAADAGSTAIVEIDGFRAIDGYHRFYDPTGYTWKVTGEGEKNLANLVSYGEASLDVRSGMMFLTNGGIFSMGATSYADNGRGGTFGVANFSGDTSELRLDNSYFVNRNGSIGRVNFNSGAILSGRGTVIAGETVKFDGAVIAPGTRYVYDDIKDSNGGPWIIGTLNLNVAPGQTVDILGNSQIRINIDQSGTTPQSSKLVVNDGNINLEEGFIVDIYRLIEGQYEIMRTPDGTISGTYAGYKLSEGSRYFALNGHLLYVDLGGGTILQSNRVLLGMGNVETSYSNDSKSLLLSIVKSDQSNNVSTTWTGANGSDWNMYAENWDAPSTYNTRQFLEGDIVTFDSSGGAIANKDIEIKTYSAGNRADTTGLSVAEINVLGTDDWSFKGGTITAYNSELYTTFKLTDPTPPTGRLNKIGSGTLTFYGNNEFFGGIHMGDASTVGGKIVLHTQRSLGEYDLSLIDRGVSKGTIFAHNTAEIETLAGVKTLTNRFVVEDGVDFTMTIAEDELTVYNTISYSEFGHEASQGGGAYYIAGSLDAGTKGLAVNYSIANHGGGVHITGAGSLTAGSLSVSNSIAYIPGGKGGGLLFDAVNNLTLSNVTLENNHSLGSGGGLYVAGNGGALTLAGETVVSGNGAVSGGGGATVAANGSLILNLSSGDVLFEKNLTSLAIETEKVEDGEPDPKRTFNIAIDRSSASSNAIDLALGATLHVTGTGTAYFYDPISGSNGSTVLVNDDASVIFHGHSRFSGATVIGDQAMFRLENGSTTLNGNTVSGMASYGVRFSYDANGNPDMDTDTWGALGDTFELTQNATLTGMGAIGAQNGVRFDGIINLDDGNETVTDSLGVLTVVGDVATAKTAVWKLTLDDSNTDVQNRVTDRIDVIGASMGTAVFTDATANDNLTLDLGKQLARGRYAVMTAENGISAFNTDLKESGALVMWKYDDSLPPIDISLKGLDGTEPSYYGRIRAATYVRPDAEGIDTLYLDITARNRHVFAIETNGMWSDNGLWEIDYTTGSLTGGNLTYDWQRHDAGPNTNVFVNGDMVTFAPTVSNQTYEITGTVRPVDLIVGGTKNVTFTGSGTINTYSTTLQSDRDATSIYHEGADPSLENDYGISRYTGKLYKQTDTTLTFAGSTTSGNMFTHGIDVGTSLSKGGVIAFGYGTQLAVGSSAFITFINDGTLRYMGGTDSTTSTALSSKIAVENGKAATFDIGTGLQLTQSGVISGEGGIIKKGEGTLVLSASNTYTGLTVFGDAIGANAGTVSIAASYNALGADYSAPAAATGQGIVNVIGQTVLTRTSGSRYLTKHFDVQADGSLAIDATTSSSAFTFRYVDDTTLNGGAIYVASDAAAQLGITGYRIAFDQNKALQGGAIYTAHDGGLSLALTGYLYLTNNAAIQGGGAVYHAGTGTVTLGQATTYSYLYGNTVVAGDGGFLHSAGDVVLNGYINLYNNTAEAGTGGGIYAAGRKVTFNASSSSIYGNRAIDGGVAYATDIEVNANASLTIGYTVSGYGNEAGNKGGAFYIENGGSLALNATSGTITFQNNTAADGEAVFLESGDITVSGPYNVYFYDTLVSGMTGNTLTKTGTGVLMFGGTGSEANNNVFSAATNINEGQFRVTQNTIYGHAGAGSAFNLASGSFLTGGGTIGVSQATLSGIVSADTYTGLMTEAGGTSAHATINQQSSAATVDQYIGNLTFTHHLTLSGANIRVDTWQSGGASINTVGKADKITVGWALNSLSTATFDIYNYDFGQYLLIEAGFAVNAAVIGNLTATVHNSALTDRHTVDIVRGDDADVAPNGGTDQQVWLKTAVHNLYMNWSGSASTSATWNPYDTDSSSNELWVNNRIAGSTNPNAEHHVINADAVRFADYKYDYASSADTTSRVVSTSVAVHSNGVLVSDMLVENALSNYTFTGGSITSTDAIRGDVLTSAPQNLTKKGAAALTLNNASNSFAGRFILQEGLVTLGSYNASNTWESGIFFEGMEALIRRISFSKATQLGNTGVTGNKITFVNSGVLNPTANVTLGNEIEIGTGATATLDTAYLVTISGTAATIHGQGDLVKIGSGILQISSAANDMEGNTAINGGTFRLTGNSVYGASTNAGDFIAAAGTTLSGNGTINADNFSHSGILSPDSKVYTSTSVPSGNVTGLLTINASAASLSNFTYQYDMGVAAANNWDAVANTGDLVHVNGALTISGTNTLNMVTTATELLPNEYYLLLSSDRDITVDPATAFSSITFNNVQIGPRVNVNVMFGLEADTTTPDRTTLWLATSRNTLETVWKSGSGVWNLTTQNWLSTQQTNGVNATRFDHGDYVVFNDNYNSQAKTINITADADSSGTAVVAGMKVDADGDYTFTGNGINAIKTNPPGKSYLEGVYISNGSLVADGGLAKSGDGTLTINNAENTFAGSLVVNAGAVSFKNVKNTFAEGIVLAGGETIITNADQLTVGAGKGIAFTGDATLTADASVLTLAHAMNIADGKTATFDTDGTLTLTGAITDAVSLSPGAVRKTGTGGVILTALSSYTGDTVIAEGSLEITGNALTAGAGGSNVSIANGAVFAIGTFASDYTLNNTILSQAAGGGLMTVGNGGNFTFGTASNAATLGSGFFGLVEMYNTAYVIDSVTTAFLGGGADLTTRTGSSGVVSSNPNTSKAWDLNGSTVKFDGGSMTWTFDSGNKPNGYIAADNIQIGDNETQIVVKLANPLVTPNHGNVADGDSLFSLQAPNPANGGQGNQGLLLATSGQDIEHINVSKLVTEMWVGNSKVDASATSTTQTISQGGTIVADGVFNYGTYATTNNELRVDHVLNRIDIYGGQTLSVVRQDGDGKYFNVVMQDKVSGQAGSVYFQAAAATSDQEIILNAVNGYTGTTTVGANTTLTMGTNNALGTVATHTSDLIAANSGSLVNLNGTSQVVGQLSINNGGVIDFNSGSTLALDNGGTVSGANALTSSGTAASTLNVNGGTLAVSGANGGLKANVNIAGGATVSIDDVQGIGSTGTVTIASQGSSIGSLVFNGATGTFQKNISGDGKVQLTGSSAIVMDSDNSGLTGSNSLFDILSNSTLTVAEAKHIGQADLAVNGSLVFNNALDWHLDTSNIITGAGTLTKQAAGTLTITHANAGFSGNTAITNGTLRLTANNAIGTASASNSVAIGANGTLELAQGVTAFGHNITGDGEALASGTGVAISGNNSGFTANGQWRITGTASVTSQQNLGSAKVDIRGTGAQLSLTTAAAGDFDWSNVLTGNGTLAVTLGSADDQLTFNTSAGNAFAGTVRISQATVELSDAGQAAINANALANATLKASAGSMVDVTGDASIGGLSFDGGRVKFDVELPPGAFAAGILDAGAKGIEITSNAGEVGISSDLSDAIKAAFDNPVDPAQHRSILDQDNAGAAAIKLAVGTVTGSANSLKLVDLNGNEITDGTLANIMEDGERAAVGTYDYSLAAGAGDEDLYVDYTLVQLELMRTEDGKALTLNNEESIDNTLSAKVTGAGNLAIEANDDEIVMNNAQNDYTGKTYVRNGTLVSGSDNALGSETSHTGELIINTDAAYDLNGYEQHIGKLTVGGTVTLGDGTLTVHDAINSIGQIDLETGTLKVNAGGVISGNDGLVGTSDSLLHVDPSVLEINGANVNFHGRTLIEGGSVVALNHTFGLGDSEIELIAEDDTLRFDIANAANAGSGQAFSGSIKGVGQLRVDAVPNSAVYITSANAEFDGQAIVEHGSLVVSHIDGVGESAIRVLADDATFTWLDIKGSGDDPVTLRNDMSGAGSIIFNDSNVKIEKANTAASYHLVDNSTVVMEHTRSLGTSDAAVSIDSTSHLKLAVDGATLGHVANSGLVSYAEPAPLTGSFMNAAMRSLEGYGAIQFNVNVPAGTADHLTIAESVSGTQTVLVNWTPWGVPADGNKSIPLIHTDNFISSPDAFKLPVNMAGHEAVDIGSYAFTLRQGNGQAITPDANEWYLVGDSLSQCAQAVVSTAAGVGLSWHMEMDSLLKRMGDLRVAQYGNYDRSNQDKAQGWVRTYGWELNLGRELAGSKTREYYYGADLGMDKYYRVEEGTYKGYLYTGMFGGMGKTDRRFNGLGSGDTDMTRAGIYASYLSDGGWYFDFVGKFNYYEHTLKSISSYGDQNRSKYNQKGMGFSFESGRQFVNAKNYFFEPQLQISYGRIWGANYTATGVIPVSVNVESQDTWQARLGARVGRHYGTAKGSLTPYMKASVVSMWTDGGRITTSDGMNHRADLDGARMEIGAGLIWDTRKYGQYYIDYEYIKASDFDVPWKVNIGYRIQF